MEIKKIKNNMTNLMLGNNMESLKKLNDNSIDAVVTDGPYGLSFMNKKWDYDVPSVDFWKEVFRVLKPGGHVLSFGGTRTYHRMTVNIEDAGFEIRDQIQWIYSTGFPKSHNIGKSVDKIKGNERKVVGENPNHRPNSPKDNSKGDFNPNSEGNKIITKGTSEWEGWGTALKPANEPICVARKPLSEKTIAENVLRWGTGGINIDGCRVKYVDGSHPKDLYGDTYMKSGYGKANSDLQSISGNKREGVYVNDEGRFPANIIFDEEAGTILDQQSGISKTTADKNYKYSNTDCSESSNTFTSRGKYTPREDKGGASRFFYCAKVSEEEEVEGLKPMSEPICVARKPLSEKTIAENVLRWGTGGINIDGCRIDTNGENISVGFKDDKGNAFIDSEKELVEKRDYKSPEGRFPANIIFDEEAGTILDQQSGISKSNSNKWQGENNSEIYGKYEKGIRQSTFSDKGGASRFFYCAKVSKKERNLGLEEFEDAERHFNLSKTVSDSKLPVKNSHPTVKPINLMAYLCRLITPPNGTVLDPFMGSGSTGIAAQLEGFNFVGMELDEDYFKVAETRVKSYEKYRELKK